ncbi:hypothetical protein GCU56_12030 [Geodermatophilus sabuli]|uniref:Cell division protein FtsL n=1 Tax=Geodermatophilus sabuli TaxID=1564158 RepID=A0A7K3W1W2_9ACTN|nr:hypothetical protein [Geodermatophilus sabuli]NEK58598.1 hypothetical protein [Geodermatophilus sabuli]
MSATARSAGANTRSAGAPADAGAGRPAPVRRSAPRAVPPLRAAAPRRPVPTPPPPPVPAASLPVAAPERPARAHSGPVRTGSLRSRPARASGTPSRSTPAPAPARVRRGAVGTRRAPLVLLVVGLLVATTLGLLFLNTAIAVNSLKATQLETANADRAQEVQRLEQQVITGGTPARLAAEATEAGLVPAGPAAYLVIGEDGTVTLRGEPAPAEAPAPVPEPGSGG